MNKVYVYGTLRPGKGETVLIPGQMFDLGSFPGVILSPSSPQNEMTSTIVAEPVLVDDKRLRELDRYEGYYPSNPSSSLYIRRPYQDGWIYDYNGPYDHRLTVPNGDWLKYKGQARGRAADLIEEEV